MTNERERMYATSAPAPVVEELTVNLAVRVAPSMLEELRQAAAREDRPVTWLVRKFIAAGLSTEKTQ